MVNGRGILILAICSNQNPQPDLRLRQAIGLASSIRRSESKQAPPSYGLGLVYSRRALASAEGVSLDDFDQEYVLCLDDIVAANPGMQLGPDQDIQDIDIGLARASMYFLSPFEKTLYVDTGILWTSGSPNQVFDLLAGCSYQWQSYSYGNIETGKPEPGDQYTFWTRPGVSLSMVADYYDISPEARYPQFCTAMGYFERGVQAERYFSTARSMYMDRASKILFNTLSFGPESWTPEEAILSAACARLGILPGNEYWRPVYSHWDKPALKFGKPLDNYYAVDCSFDPMQQRLLEWRHKQAPSAPRVKPDVGVTSSGEERIDWGMIPVMVIAMQREEERRRLITARMESIGHRNWGFYDALDAEDREEVVKHASPKAMKAMGEGYVYGKYQDLIGDDKRISPEEVACAASHLGALREFVGSDNDLALVLESDAEFRHMTDATSGVRGSNTAQGFNDRVADALIHAPSDWDMLYLGFRHLRRPMPGNRIWDLVTYGYCAHAYIVSRQAAERILDQMPEVTQPIDVAYQRMGLKRYCLRYPLVVQSPGYSYVQKKNSDNTRFTPMLDD